MIIGLPIHAEKSSNLDQKKIYMDHYFNKAIVFTDSHFGRSADSAIANQDNLDFLTWAIDRGRSWGADTCLFLGDWFHNRSSINLTTLHAGEQGLTMLSQAGFRQTNALLGNHDLARKATREISSLNFARHIPNITLINDPITIGDCSFLPWLMDDDLESLKHLKSRYVFAHLETIGAMMNARVACTGGSHAVEPDVFKQHEYLFSGHFHQRQTLKNICYIGSIMPFDFSDANDSQRGIMLLEWGKEPVFESYPEQPLYSSLSLSTLLDDLSVLRPKMTVRATVDIDLRYEEVQELRDMLISQYALRKIELINTDPLESIAYDTSKPLHTVDQIVIDGLQNLETTLSNERLISIFNDLPR